MFKFKNLKKLFISFIWSRFFGELSNNNGLKSIMDATCALEIATFNLFLLKKNSLFLGSESLSDDVIDIMVIGASWPWNLSIVPTLGFLIFASSNLEIRRLTWVLYGLITKKSSTVNDRKGSK